MKNEGRAIICPQCLEKEEKNMLGSVDYYGRFLVKRFRRNMENGTTIIQINNELTILCQCGFGTTLFYKANGVVSYNDQLPGQLEIT